MIEITPDRLCQHVEAGAERVGGVHFPTADPPVSIAMCQPCLDWSLGHDNSLIPLNSDAKDMVADRWDEFVDDQA